MMAYVECLMLLFGMLAGGEIIMSLIVFGPLILSLLALIDILRNEFTGNNKLIWILVVCLIPFIGAILYLFIGQKDKITS